MTKLSFLFALRDKLSGLPQSEIEERLRFYSEMIEDRMEEGLSEEEAVAEIGTVEEIAAQILSDCPRVEQKKEAISHKRQIKAWEIVLLILGSPVWLSLLIAVFAVIFSLYVSLWSVIVAFWAVFVAFAVCALSCIVVGIVIVISRNVLAGTSLLAVGFICTGLTILLFYGCKALTKAAAWITKKLATGIYHLFTRKENA